MCVCACVRTYVCACVHAYMRACVRAYMCACVRVCKCPHHAHVPRISKCVECNAMDSASNKLAMAIPFVKAANTFPCVGHCKKINKYGN